MSLWSRLFGSRPAVESKTTSVFETVEHKAFTITPAPAQAPGGWRVGAVIEKGGRRHDLIRADMLPDHDAAAEASVAKARQAIDQQGERLFGADQ